MHDLCFVMRANEPAQLRPKNQKPKSENRNENNKTKSVGEDEVGFEWGVRAKYKQNGFEFSS